MGPIEQLVQERLPPDRAETVQAFAQAYLRRLTTAAGEDGHDTESLYHEVLGAFELAASRDGAPMAVRAFNPTRAEHGYEPGGSVVETNTEDLPFLVDSVTAELGARGLGIVRVLHPIVGTERSADGGIVRILHPSGAPATESVMHFELDRRLAPEDLADLEDAVRSVLADVRRVVARLPAAARARRVRRRASRARAPRATRRTRWPRSSPSSSGWRATTSSSSARASTSCVDGALRVVSGSGLGLLADEDALGLRQARGGRDARPEPARAGAGRRAADGRPRPTAMSPVHRRVRMDYVGVRRVVGRRRDRRRGAPARPVHDQGLRRAGLRDAACCTASCGGSWPAEDLIEGSHDYKAAVALFDVLPQGRAVRRVRPTTCARAVVALLALQGRAGAPARPPRRATGAARRSSSRCPRGRYDAALLRAPARAVLRRRFDASTVDAHQVLDRGRPRARALHRPPRPGRPARARRAASSRREVLELARTWDDAPATSWSRATARSAGACWPSAGARRLPDSYKAAVDAGRGRRRRRLLRAAVHGRRGLPRRAAQRRGRQGSRASALYRVGDKVELSQAMPMLEHLGLRVVEEIPTRLLGGDGALWLQDFGVLGPTDQPLDLDELRRARRASASPRSGAARRSRTR